MAIPLSQYLSEAAHRDQINSGLERRKVFGAPPQESIRVHCHVEDDACRGDCHFDDISDLIDAHPIGRPMGTPLAAKP